MMPARKPPAPAGGADRGGGRLPQIIQLVHDSRYYVLPQTPLRFLASPQCDLSGGQIRLFVFLMTNSWGYGRLYAGRQKKTKLGQSYWDAMSQADIAEALGTGSGDDFKPMDRTRLNHDLAALEEVSLVYTDDQGRIYPWPFPIPHETAPETENVGGFANYFPSSALFSTAVSLKSAFENRKRSIWEAQIAPLEAEYRKRLAQLKKFSKKKPDATETDLQEIGDFANFLELSPLPQVGESANKKLADPATPSLLKKEHPKEQGEGAPSSSVVLSAFAPFGLDDDAAHQLWRACQQQVADVTVAEVVHFLNEKRPLAERNPAGFLLTAVPRAIGSELFRQFRAGKAREQAEQAAESLEAARTQAEQRAVLDDPNASEEDKQWARKMLGMDR